MHATGVLFLGERKMSKLDPNTKFELKAAAFESMRNMLAPGKDQSPYGRRSREVREQEWAEWCGKYNKVFDHFIRAVEKVL